jgi:hypothetical protein
LQYSLASRAPATFRHFFVITIVRTSGDEFVVVCGLLSMTSPDDGTGRSEASAFTGRLSTLLLMWVFTTLFKISAIAQAMCILDCRRAASSDFPGSSSSLSTRSEFKTGLSPG